MSYPGWTTGPLIIEDFTLKKPMFQKVLKVCLSLFFMVNNFFHAQSVENILEELSSKKSGLSKEQAEMKLKEYGKNELAEKKKTSLIIIFLSQFRSFLIYILILAAVISLLIGHTVDFYVILLVILFNSIIGFTHEYKAEKSIKELKKMVVAYSKVYRDGGLVQIPSSELVPGDILFLEEGDKIGADARIIESKNLQCVESSLTGESFPVEKDIKVLPVKTPFADRKNMVYMGTFVGSGSAKAVIIAIGGNTAIGKVAIEIEAIKESQSHFKKKTDTLAKQMALIAFAGAFLTFVIGYFVYDITFAEIFIFTLASLVSGIPEGLPAVLAIVLAVGAGRMARRKAIIRTLPATETLGIVNTIITDKTGTITENTMNVEKILLPGQNFVKVSGKGWNPIGEFYQRNKKINPGDNLHLSRLLMACSLCNNAHLVKEEDGEGYKVLGDPTEGALVVVSEKAGIKRDGEETKEKRIDDLPFNPELKYRASLSVLAKENGKKIIYVVGAPEAVLAHSTHFLKNNNKKILNDKDKINLLKEVDSLSSSAMRVLAVAYKEVDFKFNSLSEKMVNHLTVVGFVGIRDPPRQEVKEAIEKTKRAGIRVIMATGDHKGTAVAVAREIGLVDDKEAVAYTESELAEMSESEFRKAVREVDVFARLTPNMKLKIAKELQKQGQIIAMTGDGVNDAPALKQADIGISMGIIGTDVARESSDIILTDDNFASIVNAIEEGRIVFTNTRQVGIFLVTTNFAEDITIISALALGLGLPLLPTQILWLNLVTDGVTGVSLAVEPGHNDALNEKPRSAKENVLSKEVIPFLILMAGTMLLATVITFHQLLPYGIEKARTGAFVVMSLTQLFNVFNMRSLKYSVFRIGFFKNRFLVGGILFSFLAMIAVIYIPFLQGIFKFASLGFTEFIVLFLVSSLALIFGEGYKLIHRRVKRK